MASTKCKCLSLVLVLIVLYLLYCAIYPQEQFINYDVGDKSFLVLEII